jgi:Spy/CpxP family protein refolding chaperone
MKARLIFLTCFLSAFGAGLIVGILWQQPAKASQDRWLSELHLTPEQNEKIKAIWTDAMKNTGWQAQREKREVAQKQRDEALNALISGEQKQRYDEILGEYQKKLDELRAEEKKAKDEAYERTKAVLTETQRIAYDEMRKKRMEGRSRSRSESQKVQSGGAAEKSGSPSDSQKKAEETQQTKGF